MRAVRKPPLLAGALALAAMAISLPASAVLLTPAQSLAFSGTASVTDTNPTAGPTANANATF